MLLEFRPILLGALLCLASIHAEHRIALLIGNSTYEVRPLKNPVNDVTALGQRLAKLGFESKVLVNANTDTMETAAKAFAARLQPGDVSLFYYSGHGMQSGGVNYLIGTDFPGGSETKMTRYSLSANAVQGWLEERKASINILVLDACRDSPAEAEKRGGGSGLSGMSGAGTFVAFATAPGRTASDNPLGANGLFTASLLEALDLPNLTLDQIFNRVRRNVAAKSNEEQIPWTHSGALRDFVFNEIAATVAAPPPEVPRPPTPAAVGKLRVSLIGDRNDYVTAFESLSSTGSTVVGKIELEIAAQNGFPQLISQTGDLPGTRVAVAVTATENVRVHHLLETPSEVNSFNRIRIRIFPEDPARPARLVLQYQNVGTKKGSK